VKKMRFLLFLSALLVGGVVTVGCEDDPLDIQEDEFLVVRAFLYSGEPVEEIEITLTLPLDSEADPEPVSDASVVLAKDGESYGLVATAGSPGFYHYPGDDLHVVSGDAFELRIEHGPESVTAQTMVPEPPVGLNLSSDVMKIPELGGGFGAGRFADPITVRWENPDGSYHFVVVENMEEDPVVLPTTGLLERKPVLFTSQPVTADSMFVNALTLTHFGLHEVTLFRVNPEYADLYEGRTQDTRDLNEPPTNIQGGLGVFSAFAGRKTYFVAVPEQ
jgi:hypothetical protein